MNGLQTAEAMLEAAEADYDVILTKVAAVDDDGVTDDGARIIIRGTTGSRI